MCKTLCLLWQHRFLFPVLLISQPTTLSSNYQSAYWDTSPLHLVSRAISILNHLDHGTNVYELTMYPILILNSCTKGPLYFFTFVSQLTVDRTFQFTVCLRSLSQNLALQGLVAHMAEQSKAKVRLMDGFVFKFKAWPSCNKCLFPFTIDLKI